MNYQEAMERLERPKPQNKKSLGTNLTLAKTEPAGSVPSHAVLTYFKTDILVWAEDGSVKISDGGFMASSFTRNKINEYLPRNWWISTHELAYNKGSFVCTVNMGNEQSAPYYAGSWYKSDGTASHVMEKQDAKKLIDDVAQVVGQCVVDYLRGKLSCGDVDEHLCERLMAQQWPEREEVTRRILKGQITTATLAEVLAVYAMTDQVRSFWEEYYEASDPRKPRTNKDLIRRIELELRHPDVQKRPPGDSNRFRAIKGMMMGHGERMLLENLGFDIIEKERFPNHVSGGR